MAMCNGTMKKLDKNLPAMCKDKCHTSTGEEAEKDRLYGKMTKLKTP